MVTLSFSNGLATATPPGEVVKTKIVQAMTAESTENSATNAWNINFSNGNLNNNNKQNTNSVRAVAALGERELEGWVDAFLNCLKHKLNTKECNIYRLTNDTDIRRLAYEVATRAYTPGISTCFVVTRPKLREVFAANFRDRIAQHWVTMRINPMLEDLFRKQGDVSYNCRKGYGTLRAVERLQSEIEEVSAGYTEQAFIGTLDIKSFFMSIDKEILLKHLLPFIDSNYKGEDKDTLLWLTEVIIRHQPQHLCRRNSHPALWERLPKHKSLFGLPEGTGMPIGNITSQILANFYMSFFDEWVLARCAQHNARYVRFVDDAAVVCRDKSFILQLRKEAAAWLRANLNITLHASKFYIQEVKKGVKFVGQVIKPGRRYLSNRSVGRFRDCVNSTEELCKEILRLGITRERAIELQHKLASINSYMGFLCHTASYGIRRQAFRNKPNFWGCCYITRRFLVVKPKHKFKLTTILTRNEYAELRNMELGRGKTCARYGSNNSRTARGDNQRAGRAKPRRRNHMAVARDHAAAGELELPAAGR